MKSYDDLSRELARLLQQAEGERKKERGTVIAEIKATMAEYDLSIEDIDPSLAQGRRTAKPAAPRYRHPDTGQTWSGRGPRPPWLEAAVAAGRRVEEFLVDWPGAW